MCQSSFHTLATGTFAMLSIARYTVFAVSINHSDWHLKIFSPYHLNKRKKKSHKRKCNKNFCEWLIYKLVRFWNEVAPMYSHGEDLVNHWQSLGCTGCELVPTEPSPGSRFNRVDVINIWQNCIIVYGCIAHMIAFMVSQVVVCPKKSEVIYFIALHHFKTCAVKVSPSCPT